jgi:flagellar basal-body rod protein FlgC
MPNAPRLGLLPAFLPQQPVRPMFRALGIAASGLSAQRARIETVAANLANAEVTRGPDGSPYRRRVAVLQTATADTRLFGAVTPGGMSGTVATPAPPFGAQAFVVPALAAAARAVPAATGASWPCRCCPPRVALPVRAGRRAARRARGAGGEDRTEGPLVYEPGHPDADANGYVRYPNVRTTDELVALLDARRIYDANATVFQSAKAMLKKALEI